MDGDAIRFDPRWPAKLPPVMLLYPRLKVERRLAFGPLMLFFATCCLAAEPHALGPVDQEPLSREVRVAIADLDSGEFAAREAATEKLVAWAQAPERQSAVAVELAKALADDGTSLEVRTRLEQLTRSLPANLVQAGAAPSPGQIDSLIDQLANNSQKTREAARRHLLAITAHIGSIAPLMTAVKRRLSSSELDAELRRGLETLLDKAREAWLTGEPSAVTLPAVSDDEMTGFISALARDADATNPGVAQRQASARRELVDLVVRDDTRERVLALIESAVESNADTASRLREIADLARPAMAAEVWDHDREDWEHRQNSNLQHLYVGVPQFPEGAERATYFDRIDDRTAHCASGNSLSPGNYPVGVAIPHPVPNTERFFYLVNLPTPRHRVAYEFALKRDEATRLLEITDRTLQYFLTRNEPFHDSELLVLCQLDPVAVSRFVATYFQRVPNREITTPDGIPAGPLTVHGGICHMLVRIGRREAVPALEQLGRSGKLPALNNDEPFAIAWVAALSIALRDPWPEVDTWLAGLVADKTPLTKGEAPAELGATAAAILLERRGQAPANFELSETAERLMETVHVPGYRFEVEQARDEVLRWWQKQSISSKALP